MDIDATGLRRGLRFDAPRALHVPATRPADGAAVAGEIPTMRAGR